MRAPSKAHDRSKLSIRQRLAELGIRPRGLSLEEAAAYVGLSAGAFQKNVDMKLYPGPLQQRGARKVWDLAALDNALNAMSGIDGRPASPSDEVEDFEIDKAIDRVYPKNAA